MKTFKTIANKYEIVNFKRRDGLFNTYVQRTGNLENTYKGQAVYKIGTKTPNQPTQEEVKKLKYEL